MDDEATTIDPELKRLALDLFTEIAILEHLIRNREPSEEIGLDPARFGLLNYFCRLDIKEARVSALAWSFQETEDRIRELAADLCAQGLLAASDDRDPCVRVTPAGRARHEETVLAMAPMFAPPLLDIPREDLAVTVRTLTELRRTFDNLPDR